MFQPELLKGKRILVTGGGTGLGKEIADKYWQRARELIKAQNDKDRAPRA